MQLRAKPTSCARFRRSRADRWRRDFRRTDVKLEHATSPLQSPRVSSLSRRQPAQAKREALRPRQWTSVAFSSPPAPVLARLDATQTEARWPEVFEWIRAVLAAWVQRIKRMKIVRFASGVRVELQTQDDLGYYDYGFDVIRGSTPSGSRSPRRRRSPSLRCSCSSRAGRPARSCRDPKAGRALRRIRRATSPPHRATASCRCCPSTRGR